MNTDSADLDMVANAIVTQGYILVPTTLMKKMLSQFGSLDDWPSFARSWERLIRDPYMADHGRYRLRRHAVFSAGRTGTPSRAPHRAHFQSLDYNSLNGGIERWFEPIEDATIASASMHAILDFCQHLFGALEPNANGWDIEVHQFRIEANAQELGRPTPEGMHRDGVDYVLVLLIRRENITSGTTQIRSDQRGPLQSFTLTQPADTALLDDRKAWHGVTAVKAIDPSKPAFRDVLVITFRIKPDTRSA